MLHDGAHHFVYVGHIAVRGISLSWASPACVYLYLIVIAFSNFGCRPLRGSRQFSSASHFFILATKKSIGFRRCTVAMATLLLSATSSIDAGTSGTGNLLSTASMLLLFCF